VFDSDESQDPLMSRHLKYIASVTSGDVESVVSLFHKDAVFMPPNDRSVYGEMEMREWHQDYFQHFTIVSLQETEREVKVLGDWAIERWAYNVAIEALVGGESIRDEGRFLMNWIREADGIWRIGYAMFNSMQPVGSGTSRFLATIRKP
jgi:ketosteroid isomerase-like protein